MPTLKTATNHANSWPHPALIVATADQEQRSQLPSSHGATEDLNFTKRPVTTLKRAW